jgi:hypothetical protein
VGDVVHYHGTTYISLKDDNQFHYPDLDVYSGTGGRGTYWARVTSPPAATIIATQVLIPAGGARDIFINATSGVTSNKDDFLLLTLIPNRCRTSTLAAYLDTPQGSAASISLRYGTSGSYFDAGLSASIKAGDTTGSASQNILIDPGATLHYRLTTTGSSDVPTRIAISLSMFCDSALLPQFPQ